MPRFTPHRVWTPSFRIGATVLALLLLSPVMLATALAEDGTSTSAYTTIMTVLQRLRKMVRERSACAALVASLDEGVAAVGAEQ